MAPRFMNNLGSPSWIGRGAYCAQTAQSRSLGSEPAFFTTPLLALLTRCRYYTARPAQPLHTHTARCCICENEFEAEDTIHCPAYAGPICSLCCSLDARCEDACKLQAEAKGLEFRFESGNDLPELVYTDERRLRQVLINLLSNAIKFTESGCVTLRVRYARQLAEIEIEDTGIGIAPEDLDRMFVPFERGRIGLRSKVGGTGLGLTISKLLVEIMGGRLRARSQPGVGSSFNCTLMLSQVTTPTVTRPEQRCVRGYLGPRKSIVVTDDDPGHRDLVFGLLEPIGFHVLCASNAQQCLELAWAMPVDLFLLDVNMPGTNGWDLARMLRGTDQADRPILMVSADAYESQRAQGGQSCHDDFVVKPVDFSQLLEKIRQHMQIEWLYEEAAAPLGQSVLPADAATRALSAHLRTLVKQFQLNRYIKVLGTLRADTR